MKLFEHVGMLLMQWNKHVWGTHEVYCLIEKWNKSFQTSSVLLWIFVKDSYLKQKVCKADRQQLELMTCMGKLDFAMTFNRTLDFSKFIQNYWYLKVNFLVSENLLWDISSLR